MWFHVIQCIIQYHSMWFFSMFLRKMPAFNQYPPTSSNRLDSRSSSHQQNFFFVHRSASIGIDRHRSASKASKVPGLQKLGQPSDELRHFQDLPCHSQHFTDAIHLRCQDKMEEFSNLGNSWFVGEKTDGLFFWYCHLDDLPGFEVDQQTGMVFEDVVSWMFSWWSKHSLPLAMR